jgi:hypothetical protein
MKRSGAVGLLVGLLLALPGQAEDPVGASGEPAEGAHESLSEINKKLTNPVSDLWSIAFQQNNYLLDIPHSDLRWNSNLNFQPVLPVAVNDDWNVITRPVVTALNSVPHPKPNIAPIEWDRSTTFGDTVLMELLSPSPKVAGDWLLGLGPTFIFPTANSDFTGQGKYQIGPAGLVGYLSHKWILGVLLQQWTSFSGSDKRESVSQMNLQPVAAYFLPDGWSVGYSGNVLANFKADGGDVWTVPLGIGVGKVLRLGRLPIKVQLAGQYMPVHPDVFGQKWNIQLQVVPVIPKLIRGNLAQPSSLRFGLD